MIARTASVMGAVLMLAACVGGPIAKGGIDRSMLAGSRIMIDPRVAADIPAFERTELLSVLASSSNGAGGVIRAFPSFSFRPAGIAVVADETARNDVVNHSASKGKNWLGSTRWQARYALVLIDGAGKQVGSYAVSQTVGRGGELAARRSCFAKLIADLRAGLR